MFIAFASRSASALYRLGHRSGLVRDPLRVDVLRLGVRSTRFPSTCTDPSAEIRDHQCGLLYTQSTAALLVPVANYMQQSSGSWDPGVVIAAGANILASLLAIAVLKPWRKIVSRTRRPPSARTARSTLCCNSAHHPQGDERFFSHDTRSLVIPAHLLRALADTTRLLSVTENVQERQYYCHFRAPGMTAKR